MSTNPQNDTVEALQQRLGHHFSNPALLRLALQHASASADEPNERLEFLGDAVLNLAVSGLLFARFEQTDEGGLTRVQAHALLMRGTEGEPVADARRQPRFEVFLNGQRDEALSRLPQEGVLTALPELPEGRAADLTADHVRAVLAGTSVLPDAIAAQVDCLVAALGRQRKG